MKYLFTLTTVLIIIGSFFLSSQPTFAQTVRIIKEDGCTSVGSCVGNFKCVEKKTEYINKEVVVTIGTTNEANCNSSATGAVSPPVGVMNFSNASGSDTDGEKIGIIVFASNLLRLFALIAGIWAMFNFSAAGYMYITGMSDSGITEKVKSKVTMTVIGLAIIAGSYIIAGLIGLIMFGDAGFIINPKLYPAI